MTIQCCVCKLIRQGDGEWIKPPSNLDPYSVSHGYCPTCAREAEKQIDNSNAASAQIHAEAKQREETR